MGDHMNAQVLETIGVMRRAAAETRQPRFVIEFPRKGHSSLRIQTRRRRIDIDVWGRHALWVCGARTDRAGAWRFVASLKANGRIMQIVGGRRVWGPSRRVRPHVKLWREGYARRY